MYLSRTDCSLEHTSLRDKTRSGTVDAIVTKQKAARQLWFIRCFSPLCVIQCSLIMSSMICPAASTLAAFLGRNLIPLSASQGRAADEI